jgi:hypothetical protein
MDHLDETWNLASEWGAEREIPAEVPAGIASLAHWLRVCNSAMGGGLGFAFEVNEDFRVVRAIAAMCFFGREDVAAFFEDLRAHAADGDYLESKDDEHDSLIEGGDAIDRAFRAKAEESPELFGLEEGV